MAAFIVVVVVVVEIVIVVVLIVVAVVVVVVLVVVVIVVVVEVVIVVVVVPMPGRCNNSIIIFFWLLLGTLKLELAWYPLPQFFEKNYSWAKMLAEKKDISLTIDYSAIAQQQGQGQGKHRRLRDIENGSSHTDELELVSVQDAVLHVDMYKVDQVIRNLITNAVNFVFTFFILVQ